MRFRHVARRHFLVTWEVDPDRVSQNLPEGFSPVLVAGRALVSLASLRLSRCRVGRLPLPGWRQLNIRTYVTDRRGEPAIFFFYLRVTLPGMVELPLGVPVRATLIELRDGSVTARGLGVSFTFALSDEPVDHPPLEPPLGAHEIAYWRAAGLRRLVARHERISWQRATLDGPSQFDPVLALGFDVQAPVACAYADGIEFVAELPLEKVARA